MFPVCSTILSQPCYVWMWNVLPGSCVPTLGPQWSIVSGGWGNFGTMVQGTSVAERRSWRGYPLVILAQALGSLVQAAHCKLPQPPEYSKPPHHNELYFLKLWTKTKAFLPQVVHVKDLSLWPEKCPLCLILSGNFYRPMTRNIWQSFYGPGWLWTHCIKPYTVTVSAVWSPCSWAAGSIASSYRQRAIVMQRPGQQVGEAEFFGG